jgi:hypothetical protein
MPTLSNSVADGLLIGDAATSGATSRAMDGLSIHDASFFAVKTLVTDALCVYETVTDRGVTTAVDSLSISDTADGGQTLADHAVDQAAISDRTWARIADYAVDSVGISDALSSPIIDDAKSSIGINETVVQTAVASNAIVDRMRVTDVVDPSVEDSVTDALSIHETVDDIQTVADFVVDALSIGETVTPAASARSMITDGVRVTEIFTDLASTSDRAVDHGYIADRFFGYNPGNAWTAPTEIMAMSRYENYPFDSMAMVNGHLLGSIDGTAFLMEGDLDFGNTGSPTNIDASVETDWLDGDTPHLKRARYTYVSAKLFGDLGVDIRYADEAGAVQTASYVFPTATSEHFRNIRATLGRGIRSSELKVTIYNTDGTDFELNEGRLVVDKLVRNI